MTSSAFGGYKTLVLRLWTEERNVKAACEDYSEGKASVIESATPIAIAFQAEGRFSLREHEPRKT